MKRTPEIDIRDRRVLIRLPDGSAVWAHVFAATERQRERLMERLVRLYEEAGQ